MQDLQEVFNRIKESQKKQKDINSIYKDALEGSQSYQETNDKLKALREKKKSIEGSIRSDFGSEFTKLEGIKMDLKTDKELMSDIAMSQLMKGQTVEVKDEYENDYEPIFSVKFKKSWLNRNSGRLFSSF